MFSRVNFLLNVTRDSVPVQSILIFENVKNVIVGRMMRDGCLVRILREFLLLTFRVETTASIVWGRNSKALLKARYSLLPSSNINGMQPCHWSHWELTPTPGGLKTKAWESPLASRAEPQAKYVNMNLPLRKPLREPPSSIGLATPFLRALARPITSLNILRFFKMINHFAFIHQNQKVIELSVAVNNNESIQMTLSRREDGDGVGGKEFCFGDSSTIPKHQSEQTGSLLAV